MEMGREMKTRSKMEVGMRWRRHGGDRDGDGSEIRD
jgi:hypothetical protein